MRIRVAPPPTVYRSIKRQQSFLDRTDVEVFTAFTNDEALEIHRHEKVDLIITDLDMPGMDIEQCCSLIRKDRMLNKVSLLMLCSRSSVAIEKSLRCGVNGLIIRPVDQALLLARAQRLIHDARRL